MTSTKTLKVIYGPTASGKTSLAIKIAMHHQTEIISADSRQFYKEMRIGTAVPELHELNSVKHHFIQHKSIHESYNVGDYENDAISTIKQLFKLYDTLVLVGGSGLYIDAICKGFDGFPNIDEKLRISIRKDFEKNGLQWLQNEVKRHDITFYQNADINNHQRLLRCLEVCLQSGQTFSSFKTSKTKKRPFEITYYCPKIDREVLYQKINSRVDLMMEKGLLKEVEKLTEYQDLNALQTVGYKELFAYLNHDINLENAINLIKQNSRRYAKRQISWLKRYPINWLN